MREILITGGSGLLALNWAVAMRDVHPVALGLHRRAAALSGVAVREFGLDSADDVSRVLEAAQPSCVVHTAGLTDVETCEANPSLAEQVNIGLAVNVARACAKTGTPLAHISTDHLFAGTEAMVDEAQVPAPVNVYARTKAEAEVRVLEENELALVVRTNFYGWGTSYRRSFSDTIIQSLQRGERVTLFEDVFYTPILAEALARTVHAMLDLRASGVFHVAGDERLSKYAFGRRVAAHFALDDRLIVPVALADLPTKTRRPRDMSISNAKARLLLGRPLGGVDEHLNRLREQELLGQSGELKAL